jgi:hypothetical protein
MRKAFIALVTVAAIAVGAGGASVAHASPSGVAYCQSHKCLGLFDKTFGDGAEVIRTGSPWFPDPDFRNDTIFGTSQHGFNDRMESYINNTPITWCLYADINFRPSPPMLRIPPSGTAIITPFGQFRNIASSVQPCAI